MTTPNPFWHEDDVATDDSVRLAVVDLLFDLQAREIPVDHAWALSAAITARVPEALDDGRIGVHSIHVAGSQNGWERPDFSTEERLIVSRRTKFTLRVPQDMVDIISERLRGAHFDLHGCDVVLGSAKERAISKQSTLFSRYVLSDSEEEEMDFLQRVAAELAQRGIRIKKALCGKQQRIYAPDGPLSSRSLLLAQLSADDSIELQQSGIGSGRHMGFGIFIPHKGIEAVKKLDDDE
jgi:CRISPR-associated protein Cas6